jgi:hypothetical protein
MFSPRYVLTHPSTQFPIITLKHDDIAKAVIARKTRDECFPNLTYTLSDDRKSITSVTVNAANASCGTAIPVTVPGSVGVASAAGATKEQVGKDPLTLWVTLGGGARTYHLGKELAL